jgi:hypothetical protein
MVAATRIRSFDHLRALATSSALAGYYREMYRPAAMTSLVEDILAGRPITI